MSSLYRTDKIRSRFESLRILSQDEHVIFHRLLQKRLVTLGQIETKRNGVATQKELSEAVEITRIQQRIERGLAGQLGEISLDHAPDEGD